MNLKHTPRENPPQLKYRKADGKRYWIIYRNVQVKGKRKIQVLKRLGAVSVSEAKRAYVSYIDAGGENILFTTAEELHREHYEGRIGIDITAKTHAHYINVIRPAIEFYQFDRIHGIDYARVEAYKKLLIDRGLENRSVNIHLTALKKVLEFAHKTGKKNPLPLIERLPEYNPETVDVQFKTPAEIHKLMQHANTAQYLTIAFMFYTGVRVVEFERLTRSKIDIKKREIKIANVSVFNRGGKKREVFNKLKGERVVLFNEQVLPIVEELCHGLNPEDRVCPYANGRSLRKSIKTLGKRLGIHVTPKLFRKTFATLESMSGTDIRILAQKMGHKDIRTTMRYQGVSMDMLKLNRNNLNLSKLLEMTSDEKSKEA